MGSKSRTLATSKFHFIRCGTTYHIHLWHYR